MSLASPDWTPEQDAEHRARMERMTAAAEAAWNAEPPTTREDPRRQADIDARAEDRQDRRAYELAHLEDREERSA